MYAAGCDEPISKINDSYWVMRAEAVPEDELEEAEDDLTIHVGHVSVTEGKHVCSSP